MVALFVPLSARAYVRSVSAKSHAPFTWEVSCIPVRPDARGSVDLSLDDITATLARAADNWNGPVATCGNPRLIVQNPNGPLERLNDGQPAVIFRDDDWGIYGPSHVPEVIGLTTVFFVSTPGQPGDGTILDADIELNGVNHTFLIVTESTDLQNLPLRAGTNDAADLENTLTHELGHVLGLAHTCDDGTQPPPVLDENGMTVPNCGDVTDPAVLDTTMFPSTSMQGETKKRSIEMDDLHGVCDVYPNTAPPAACFQRLRGGYCSVGDTHAAPFVWAFAPIGIALLLRRRRRA